MILISSFLSGLFLIVISALLGYFISFFFKKISSINFPKATLLGLALIVVFYSLFKTTFNTINILCIPLFIFYLWSQNSKRELTLKKIFHLVISKNLFFVLIVHFFTFIYFSFLYFDFDLFEIKYVWYDTVYYSNLSRGINNSNVENSSSVFYQFSNIKHVNLYHYFDIWLNIIATKISGLSHYTTLVLVTYPVLLSVFYFTLIDRFKKSKIQLLIMAIILPIAVNTPFFPKEGFFSIYGLHLNIFSIDNSKILINYILILTCSFALLDKKINEFLFYSLLTVIFYSTTIISIIPTVGILLLLVMIKRKYFETQKVEIKKYFYVFVFFILTLALFLLLNKFKHKDTDSLQFVQASFKTAAIVFIGYYIKYCLAYSLAILICAYTIYVIYRKKLFQENIGYIFALIFFMLIAFNAILFASIFHGANMNYPQSISNIQVCCFTSLTIISFCTLTTKLKFKLNWFLYTFIIGIATYGIYQSINHSKSYPHKYSKEFKNSVLESFKNDKSPKYISISKGDNEMKFCTKYSKPQELDFSNICYIYNRTNGFLVEVDNISVGADITFDSNFINHVDEFQQKIKAEDITHIFVSKDILLNIPHKKLMVDCITKQKVYVL